MLTAASVTYWLRTTGRLRWPRSRPARYATLLRLVRASRARRILEIGTHDGTNAVEMIETASLAHPRSSVEYFGFDLFEALTDDLLKSEQALRPPTRETVERTLRDTGAAVRLFAGNTRDLLPAAVASIGTVDFVFIDGGHSFETIESDWNAVQRVLGPQTVVVFDDFYENPTEDIPGLGCQDLVGRLDRSLWEVDLLLPVERFAHAWGTLVLRLVKVSRARPA